MSVILHCVSVQRKLRVRVLSSGYYNDANVQFPRALRVEGRQFSVPESSIRLITTRGQWFYSVINRSAITVFGDGDIVPTLGVDLTSVKIFTDETDPLCVVCMDTEKSIVLFCGHFVLCEPCSKRLVKCPMCRGAITKRIPIADFSTV